MDDFILAKLNYIQISPISLDEPTLIPADNYSDYLWKIVTYLTTFFLFCLLIFYIYVQPYKL